ncbi:MAG: BspA family leucine-rich repeat surface protein, partial [Cytophagales bacterium]
DDLTTPSNLKLFTRINNSGTSTWSQVGSANSADDVTKEINFNSPTNTFLGEFVVGTNTIPISPFITTWKTTTGTITIPTFTGETYNYNITWTNLTNAGAGDGSVTNVTGDYTITGLTNNDTYKVEISGTFPRIYFSFNPERLKIQTIEQWGSITWSSMHRAFFGCENLTHNATIAPNLTNVTDMSLMFAACPLFNGNIGNWNTANVTNMSGLFGGCTVFNQNIGSWNTANVSNMSDMFTSASTFNQNIGNWNVSNVTDMSYMFSRATSFNQNINNWTTSNVTNMSNMFEQANSFNQPLINWNVSNVTNMTYMFRANTAFNQSLSTGMFSGWNTANVTSMNGMFFGATNFNQNIGGLNISNVTDMNFMLINCGMTTFNYDNTLIGFQFQANNYFVQPNITIGVDGLRYCQGLNARNTLISTRNWTFVGDALACPFITTWVTTTTTITIPTTGTGYNYSITWENLSNFGVGNGSATGITGNYTITGLTNGNLYQISIAGNFPRIFFVNGDGQAPKLRTVVQWGNIAWTSMASAFNGCSNLTTIPTAEAPNLSNVTDMSNMFAGASQMNSNISNWNVSNITNMSKLFEGATQFNQNIASWNVSNVTNMSSMFSVATAFNQDISGWNVGNVTNMSFMFAGFMTLTNFNQNINSWNVSNVTNMEGMFQRSVFNQNISGWNVGNVTNMQSMFFNNTLFNQNIGSWNVSNVTNMSSMFSGATNFNQNIGSWNVGNVISMQGMFFNNTIFNQNIGGWNVGNVTNMTNMFNGANTFNQNIGGWNVGNVISMQSMFENNNAFNQNISTWNVSNVTNMISMFNNAITFNQNIGNWQLRSNVVLNSMLNNSGINLANYESILAGWATQSVTGRTLGATGRQYCNVTNRNILTSTKGWTITGDAVRCINVSTKRTNALVFNGSIQSAMTSSVITTATTGVSIEGWVNFNSTGGGGAICIFYNGNNFANGYGLYLLSNKIQILFGGITLTDTGVTPSLNTWIHLALVNNGTSWAVYQNGVQIGANFFISAIAPTNNFRIGSNVNGTAEFLNGQVDEVRVWNIGISATQIRENMHLTLNGTQINLIAYYQINETSGNNVVDGISTRNITLNNVTRTTSTLAVASGSFHRRNISVGMNNFTNANVTINFTNAPLDEFVAYQLNDNPINGVNINNLGSSPSCYWIVRQFGGGAVAYNQMNFTLPASNTISAIDEATPSNLKLYKRPDNSTVVFGASIANATTANNTTKIIEFAGLSEISFSQFEISSAFSPLPVTLLGWRAERLERGGEKTEEIKLSWETATEINNKGFEIESSENAVSFTKIAFVDGAGNSNNLKNY